ncbi:C6 transcription factor FacB/Cat8 [Aspergillus brunneoviolaceus CBS 621.78]|uniref:Acetate regulatory DNA binding protein FacB n=1 Tax=Aspergillus brunneoviolaceus CBS 621.78 TaxID=1450534 RepID=A0ACD1G6H4_9EURO|nr:acetate regulatory DNA binding protein FacB [Aspergillus brunneoviolaceus CBS 621.78]RAH44767.1 acetate regulatory DNA binding protein FacB [Aspergillus brunneoviolaceus CBS 621.78]
MPGILPMKVIKVGNGAQSRIAQACDRCRSKKIRCDGVRPCCTQCANVGFECKTSDKLSRRAFPRGYTESLEERVRALESEVRDLKNLLDEKDEKIDVLSRIHSFSTSSQGKANTAARSPSAPVKHGQPAIEEGVIRVRQLPQSQDANESTVCAGVSSTQGYVDAFVNKLSDQNRLPPNFSIRALTAAPPSISRSRIDQTLKTAPRLVSDQLINIFFQEWAPLYPVVHRPTILKAYEQYLSGTESLRDNKHNLTQLNLIFGIAALASASRTNQDPSFFEDNWSPMLESISNDISIHTLQCYVLAQMYCMAKGDYSSLGSYRGFAVNLCHQLRLHQSQKRFVSNPLVAETRKKVFWCQYVLDRFTAALTGLPVVLREQDIKTEYPEDIDDENVTETGFLPTLPGETTRISSSIALFAASRVLNKALEDVYPGDGDYDISLPKMRLVAEQLDEWVKGLPAHLRLEFTQDKPSTNVTSSRSPLLSLVYYFIRSLIHRPAVCFGEDCVRSPSLLVISDSAKHIIQILQLLDERRLCLSLSFNRKELIFATGLNFLWQNLNLKHDSKLAKESQKWITTVVDQLETESSPIAAEFNALARVMVSLDSHKHGSSIGPSDMSPPAQKPLKSPKKQLQSWKARLTGHSSPSQTEKQDSSSRRATISGASTHPNARHIRSSSWASLPLDNVHAPPMLAEKAYHRSASMAFDGSHALSSSAPSDATAGPITVSDWEFVLSDMDRGYSNIFTGIYGGRECGEDSGPFASITAEYAPKPDHNTMSRSELQGLSPEAWSASSNSDLQQGQEAAAQSVLSYSDESMASPGDGIPYNDVHLSPEEHANLLDPFHGIMVPGVDDEVHDFGLINGWDRRLAV